jgi:hypothetical protein
MLALCRWIDQNAFFMYINSSTFFSVVLEVSHYFSMMMIVGTMGMVDLRILGLAGKKQNLADVAEDLLPWMWTGVVVNTISGILMFCGEATAYWLSGPFRIKMLLIITAIIFGAIVNQNAPKWGRQPSVSTGVKVVALISMLLWIVTILAGNEVPAISGTG